MKNFWEKASVKWILFSVIIITSASIHAPHFSKDIIGVHIWRQTQTQWNINNFYRHDFNILNPRVCVFNAEGSNIHRYEFPLMQWLIACLMKVFGDTVLVTRIFIFCIGLLSTLGMYKILKLLTSHEVGSWMGAWAFSFSPIFFYYTINPIPDNFALFGGVWFLYFFLKYTKTQIQRDVIWSAFFLLLAVLAKLPFIILAAGAGIYFIRKWKERTTYKIVLIYLLFMLPALAWYLWVIPGWGGNGVLYGIFRNEIPAERYFDIIDFHKNVMFPKLLLNDASVYIFGIGILFFLMYEKYKRPEFILLLASALACLAYLLLELNMIEKIHDYYMMPFLPILYIVVGYGFTCLWRSNKILKLAALVFVVEAAAVTQHETEKMWSIERSYTNPDAFIYKEELRKAVPDDAKCFMLRDQSPYTLPYLFNKMGYMSGEQSYSPQDLKDKIEKGVKYMYSDTRSVDSSADLQPFIKRLVMQKGSFKVFELQDAPL